MSLPLEDALLEYPDVSNQKGHNAQAYLLVRNHDYAVKDVTINKFASPAGIVRAERAICNGFEACRSGRHQKLNDHDELILENWILELLERGETVHSCTVIQMVCCNCCCIVTLVLGNIST